MHKLNKLVVMVSRFTCGISLNVSPDVNLAKRGPACDIEVRT